MAAFNKDELAKLVSKCTGEGLIDVPDVVEAYDTMCKLVELEELLENAVEQNNQQQLGIAVAEATSFNAT